jgi:hypothetical protein
MGKVISSFVYTIMVVTFLAVLSTDALAGTKVLTFDGNNWGASCFAPYSCSTSFEGSGGNPGACMLLKGISRASAGFENPGFTGDFAAGGYGQIAFDIKVKHWFPNPSKPTPVAYVFVSGGYGYQPWCKQIQGFAPVTTGWKRYSVDFNPEWSDIEAKSHGWDIIIFPGGPLEAKTASFKETLHNVYESGMWTTVIDGGAECHIFLDNYSLLPGSGGGSSTETGSVKGSPTPQGSGGGSPTLPGSVDASPNPNVGPTRNIPKPVKTLPRKLKK